MTSLDETPAAAPPARVFNGPWRRSPPRWRRWLAQAWREGIEMLALASEHRLRGGWFWP